MVDIMVRAEDASKINRIVERFKFVTIDTASIKNDVQKSKDGKDKGIIVKSIEEKLVDDILTKPINKEEQEVSNPQVAKMEKSPLSEPTSKNKNKSDQGAKLEKPSVREEIKQIKEEQKQKADNNLDKSELSKEKDSKNKMMRRKKNTFRMLSSLLLVQTVWFWHFCAVLMTKKNWKAAICVPFCISIRHWHRLRSEFCRCPRN